MPDLAAVGRRTKHRREPLPELIGLERLDRRAAGNRKSKKELAKVKERLEPTGYFAGRRAAGSSHTSRL